MKRISLGRPAPRVVLWTLLMCLTAGAARGAVGGPDSRGAFFERLVALCGATFEGKSSYPVEGSFAGKVLVAEFAKCSETEVRIPFAVAEDRSRTWIITWNGHGLLLKHDHRHEDGTPDEVTMYGGWATDGGSDRSQAFAADDHTKRLLPEAATNVWTISLSEDGSELTYYLERHEAPRFEATLLRESGSSPD